jgi:hypothetical protein
MAEFFFVIRANVLRLGEAQTRQICRFDSPQMRQHYLLASIDITIRNFNLRAYPIAKVALVLRFCNTDSAQPQR